MVKPYLVKNARSAVDELKHVPLINRILLSRWYQLSIILAITAIISPLLLILLIYSVNLPNSIDHPIADTCDILNSYRVPCDNHLPNITEHQCDQLQCCFIDNKCFHRAPSRYGYKWSDKEGRFLVKRKYTPIGNPSTKYLNIQVEEISSNELNIKFYNPSEIQLNEERKLYSGLSGPKNYNYSIDRDNAGISVNRIQNGSALEIFTTNMGPLISSDGYWEITVSLNASDVFGLGQLLLKKHEKFTFYNNPNDLNRLPIIMAHRNKKYHSLNIKTNGLLEIEMLESKLFILRCLTWSPIGFEFDLIIGDSPKDISAIYRKKLQSKNLLEPPPYWVFGLHICRNSLNLPEINAAFNLAKEFRQKAEKYNLPYESDCIHGNLFSLVMDQTDDEKNAIVTFIQNELIDQKRRFIMEFSPQIAKNSSAYTDALNRNILFKNPSECSQPLNFTYLERDVSYPDYNNINTTEWFQKYFKEVPAIEYTAGLILKDNWPLYQSDSIVNATNSSLLFFDKKIKESILSTLPWNSTTTCSENPTEFHIENHNKYGYNFLKQFISYFQTKQLDIILSASHHLNANSSIRFGPLNQNLNMSWLNLQKTLSQSLFYSIFIDPVVFTTPVCGSTEYFDFDFGADLCTRWYLTAVTFPLMYISSIEPNRDPFSLPSLFSQNQVIVAVQKRYQFLPYFNTVLRPSKTEAEPLIRPMFYNFPFDNVTFGLSGQYMMGQALLIVQVLRPLLTDTDVYLPKEFNRNISMWYEFWHGQQYNVTAGNGTDLNGSGRMIKIFPMISDWIMYILGGNIVAIHNFQDIKSGNAESNRINPLTIAVALNCPGDSQSDCFATGQHLVDDNTKGEINFKSNITCLEVNNLNSLKNVCQDKNLQKANTINKLLIYGLGPTRLKEIDLKASVNLCQIKNDFVFICYDLQ